MWSERNRPPHLGEVLTTRALFLREGALTVRRARPLCRPYCFHNGLRPSRFIESVLDTHDLDEWMPKPKWMRSYNCVRVRHQRESNNKKRAWETCRANCKKQGLV